MTKSTDPSIPSSSQPSDLQLCSRCGELRGPSDERRRWPNLLPPEDATSFGTPPVPRLAQLTDQLWTGGALSHRTDAATHAIEFWRSVGMNAVVDTRLEWTDGELISQVAREIAFLDEGVIDGGQPMRESWFDNITDFAVQHLDAGASVLIHCGSGINRGPSAAFAVLLCLGWDSVDAIELIRPGHRSGP